MNEKTIIDTFNYYFGYWIVKLGFDKKYKFTIKKDNRIDCMAKINVVGNYKYLVTFNTKEINAKFKIIHVILHELGHLLYSLNLPEFKKEYLAEKFAIETIKKEYPQFYKKSINWLKESVFKYKHKLDKSHLNAYTKILEELGEI